MRAFFFIVLMRGAEAIRDRPFSSGSIFNAGSWYRLGGCARSHENISRSVAFCYGGVFSVSWLSACRARSEIYGLGSILVLRC